MDVEKTCGANTRSILEKEMTQMEEMASWQKTLARNDVIGEQMRATSAISAWQKSEQTLQDRMRKLIDPAADIRKSLLGDSMTQQLLKQFKEDSWIDGYAKQLREQSSLGAMAKMLKQQMEASHAFTKELASSLHLDSSVQSYLKDFEQINNRWMVPREILGIGGSLTDLQERLSLGKVTLPTIDWDSAAALANVLGKEGILEQLSLLGIGSDGSMAPPKEMPEKGLLSRKQSDAVARVSLLLGLLFFMYQEISSQQADAKTEEFRSQATATLQTQAQQIQNLTVLISQALVQAAQEPEERFVVRDRAAIVRSQPEHGSPVDGSLLPNEVVRAIDKHGKWVEVEYYHWLREEYRTGWVLKKYLERVPMNYSKSSS